MTADLRLVPTPPVESHRPDEQELVGGWTLLWTDDLPERINGATRWSDRTIGAP